MLPLPACCSGVVGAMNAATGEWFLKKLVLRSHGFPNVLKQMGRSLAEMSNEHIKLSWSGYLHRKPRHPRETPMALENISELCTRKFIIFNLRVKKSRAVRVSHTFFLRRSRLVMTFGTAAASPVLRATLGARTCAPRSGRAARVLVAVA